MLELDNINTWKDWGISLLIIAGGVILCKLISMLNKKYLQKLTSKTKTYFDDILLNAVETPVLLGIMLFVIWIGLDRLHFPQKIDDIISKSYHILITLNITWFFAKFSGSLIEQYKLKKEKECEHKINSSVIMFINRLVVGFIWCIGIITALNNVGVKVTTLISALGIGGVAIALASQDFLKNILGGFTLFTDQPFRIGDQIRVDNFEGNIENIGVRSTRIRLLNGRLVTMPNSRIVDASIENVSDEPGRQVVMKIGLIYNTTPEKMDTALSILRNLINEVKGVTRGKGSANFTDFADSALIITFIYWINKSNDVLGVSSGMNMAILTKFNEANLEFAFPSQTLYLEKSSEQNPLTKPDLNQQ